MDNFGKLKKIWKFFWHNDSVASWLANVVVAFLVIRFLVYPLLGIILGTGFPIVAVVSESMEHSVDQHGIICGQHFEEYHYSYNNYWKSCGEWYETRGITQKQFKKFPLTNGFNKGDVIILWRANTKNIKLGDVLIFQGGKPQPIIHRVVEIREENGGYFYQTKGDHNSESIQGQYGETAIDITRIEGKGILRIPYLGWVKIIFVDLVRPFGWNIQR
jgi:signal peptidase I